jgi:thiol-disulfide isomerase/thioredoxin
MPLRIGTDMPELTGATEWVGPEVKREELAGSPTLVHFWSTSCYICKNNLPTLRKWEETYGPKGLKVVAVHMPRSEAELGVEKVKAAIAEYGITDPCAIDNEHEIGDRFQTAGLWPHYFLFDADGKMRSRAAGDAGLKMIEASLKRLFKADSAS